MLHSISPWLTDGLPWVLVAAGLLLGASVAVGILAAQRLKRIEERLASLDRLEDLKRDLGRLTEGHTELDLRRLEHILIDIRDDQRRVEDRLLAVAEAGMSGGGEPQGDGGKGLADRVTTRLLALGYERVQLVTAAGEIAELADEDGEILVEARRDGAFCKGRVRIREGGIAEVDLRSAHSAFP